MITIIFASLTLQAAEPAPPQIVFERPPRARAVEGDIEAVVLGPVFRETFVCAEHHDGQMDWAGDALGTDCMVTGGMGEGPGFMRLYRNEGLTNEDWYGWGADVLAPVDGEVVGLLPNPVTNTPGTTGRPPAGMLQIRTDDGLIVTLAHVKDPVVAAGDRVEMGQPIASVGNNGFARAPHIHIGVHRDGLPFQIRWDQREMARHAADGSE